MVQKYPIDTGWFRDQLKRNKKAAGDLARFLGVHKSTVSRILHGHQRMTAEEQDKVAQFLGVELGDIVAHRAMTSRTGFGENMQEGYVIGGARDATVDTRMFKEADIVHKEGKRWIEGPDGSLVPLHPIFGCMKGTMIIPDDLDLTAPVDPDWGKVYGDD